MVQESYENPIPSCAEPFLFEIAHRDRAGKKRDAFVNGGVAQAMALRQRMQS